MSDSLEPEATRPGPQFVNSFHTHDDVDSSTLAHHHTLGTKDNQAAPGNLLRDSGWTDLTLNAAGNWQNVAGTPNIEYRKVGSRVTLRGKAERTAGANATIGTLPVDYRPNQNFDSAVRTGAGTIAFQVSAAGVITVGPAYVNGDDVSVDGIEFYVN